MWPLQGRKRADYWFQVSAQPLAKKTADQIEKETDSSPQSSQRTPRKKI
jgi:hypothetical protein